MGRRFDPRNRMQLDGENLPIPEEEIPTIEAVPATSEDTDMMDEEVAAEPVTEESMPVEPETEESVPEKLAVEARPTPALATPVPPASTAALEAAKSPEEDEYETMMRDYARAQKDYGIDYEKLVTQAEEDAQSDRRLAGIAAVVQSFGEGISAITGSSTKPLQTATESIRRMSEMRAAERGEKAKTLKERLMQKRAPIEAKMEETKFRDVFEQRQKAKRLADPASPESKQARELANNFLDAYIASVANRTDQTQLARIEGIRPRLENLSANQIKDFVDNLNKLKFTESKAELEDIKASYKQESDRAKAEAKKLEATTKREQKLQDVAEKEFSADSKRLVETVDGLKRFQQRIGIFQNDVKAALAGDKEAANRVVQNQGAVSYLIARQDEPKGVFTEGDYKALNRLGSGLTWSQQLKNWVSQGFNAEYTPDALKNLDDVLSQLEFTKQDPNEIITNYKKIYEMSDNPFKKEYANRFDKVVSLPAKSAAQESTDTQEPAAPQDSPKTITIGKNTYKEGDIVVTPNPTYKKNTKAIPHRVRINQKTGKPFLDPQERDE